MQLNKKFVLQAGLTFVVWLMLFIIPFLFFPYRRTAPAFESERFVWWLVYSNVFLMLFYYFNIKLLIPKFLARKKIFVYLLIVIACFFVFLFFFHTISIYSQETKEFIERAQRRAQRNNAPYRARRFWEIYFMPGPIVMFLIAFLFSTLSKIVSEWFLAEEKKEEVERRHISTELHLLRSQVNPHFLFNTLNGIYSLAVVKDDKTPDAVLKLSRIMRYTLEESQTEMVELSKEIEFMKSYIDLQKLRSNEKLHVHLEVKGDVENVKIAPLLFIPFIENAFKYGVSAHSDANIYILIEKINKRLIFRCENDIFPGQKIKSGTGTGISNARRRLQLLYENNFELKIKSKENHHTVDLFIDLK